MICAENGVYEIAQENNTNKHLIFPSPLKDRFAQIIKGPKTKVIISEFPKHTTEPTEKEIPKKELVVFESQQRENHFGPLDMLWSPKGDRIYIRFGFYLLMR